MISFPVNPGKHSHWKLPVVSVHWVLLPQLWVPLLHSLMSEFGKSE